MGRYITKDEFNQILELKKINDRDDYYNFNTIIEGERLIKQIIDYSIPITKIFITPKKIKLLDSFSKEHLNFLFISEKQAHRLTETKNEQGIFALVNFQLKKIVRVNRVIYLNNIQDPGNVGTIIRTASAFNINGIILDEQCCDIANPKVIRASLGAISDVPFLKVKTEWLKTRKELFIYSNPNTGTPLQNFNFPLENFIVFIGSEANGISNDIKQFEHQDIFIPTSGKMQSLNAAIATGIILHHLFSLKNL